MKRIIVITLTVLLVTAIMFGGCAEEAPTPAPTPTPTPTPPPAKAIELKWASFIPPFDIYSLQAEAWGKRVEEATNGRVKITYYWAESLVKAPDLLEATIAGTIDFAQTDPYWTPERLMMAWVTGIPMLFDRPSQAGQAAIALLRKYKELQDQFYPTTVIMWQVPGPNNIASNVPIRSLEDMKGLRTFGTGWNELEGARAVGGVPVAMNPGERYTALERGVLDATIDDFNAVWSWKVHEVTKYRTDGIRMNLRSTPWIMNLDSYNALPADVKTQFDSVTDPMEMSKTVNEIYEKQLIESTNLLKEYDKEVGNPEFFVLSDAERARWMELIKPVQEQWVSDLEAKGLPGKAFFEDAKAFAEQYK